MFFIIPGQSQCQDSCVTRRSGREGMHVPDTIPQLAQQGLTKLAVFPKFALSQSFPDLGLQGNSGSTPRLLTQARQFYFVLILAFVPGVWNRQQLCQRAKWEPSSCKVENHSGERGVVASTTKARVNILFLAMFICYVMLAQ